MGLKLSIFQNQHNVQKHSEHKNELGVGFELEFGVEIKLSDQESSANVFCENLNDTPLYVDINLVSENQSQNAETQLCEPG